MKERPILFSASMVRALLSCSKTQTRRVVSGWKLDWLLPGMFSPEYLALPENKACPYGYAGDQLWVKETWNTLASYDTVKPSELPDSAPIRYRGGNDQMALQGFSTNWRTSLFMQKRFSRLQLGVTGIRVERLNDCSDDDAIAEGIFTKLNKSETIGGYPTATTLDGREIIVLPDIAKLEYKALWDSINGAGSWDTNPWVWVVEFRVIKP